MRNLGDLTIGKTHPTLKKWASFLQLPWSAAGRNFLETMALKTMDSNANYDKFVMCHFIILLTRIVTYLLHSLLSNCLWATHSGIKCIFTLMLNRLSHVKQIFYLNKLFYFRTHHVFNIMIRLIHVLISFVLAFYLQRKLLPSLNIFMSRLWVFTLFKFCHTKKKLF